MNVREELHLSQTGMELPEGIREFWLACTDGDINLSSRDIWTVNPPDFLFTPSQAARRSYLYPQCVSMGNFGPDHYTRRRGMQSYLLSQTFSGAGELRYEGETVRLAPDDCFLIDCRREHCYYAVDPDGWSYRILHFDGQAMADLYAHFLQCGTVKFTAAKGEPVRALLDGLFEQRPPAQAHREIVYSRMLTDLMTEIILKTSPGDQAPMPELVRGVLDYIGRNYAAPITLDLLAQRFYVSKFHLCREFKRHTGFSPNEYLIDTRLNAAKALLRGTDMTMQEICQQVGISGPDHFLYLFKSRENIQPSVYRKQWQNVRAED